MHAVNDLLAVSAFVFYLGVAVFTVYLNLWLPCSHRAVGSFLNIFGLSDVRPTSGHSFSLERCGVLCRERDLDSLSFGCEVNLNLEARR